MQAPTGKTRAAERRYTGKVVKGTIFDAKMLSARFPHTLKA